VNFHSVVNEWPLSSAEYKLVQYLSGRARKGDGREHVASIDQEQPYGGFELSARYVELMVLSGAGEHSLGF